MEQPVLSGCSMQIKIMFPSFIVFGKIIGLYQIMVLFGVFSAGIYSSLVAEKNKINGADVIIVLLVAGIGAILGSHLLYIMVNFSQIIEAQIKYLEVFHLFFNGSVFYGGLIGGILTVTVFKKKFVGIDEIIDIVTPTVPLFHFWGRIGCFFTGCCFGVESSFGFTFDHAIIEKANGINRFPVQLLEACFNLGIFIFLDYLRRRNFFKNRLLYLYLLIYSVGRFFIEFIRGDEYRGKLLFLSTSQIISVIILCVAITKLSKKGPPRHPCLDAS
ncbi:MAG: prolipoprotein diacylglyceryl transferase [Treponema sp.]|jgi:phosphatidylglycerol:prolipoprotein diacylglycerol transferase|nr:prolipoprotein diacylglyceryl transferase [Treponema sp.]